jgi:signal transduction histidine kinase
VRRMLRSAWDLPRAPGASAHVWRDAVLVGVLGVLAVIETLVRPDLPWRWATLAVVLAVLPTLLWRRTHPGLMTAIGFGMLLLWDLIRAAAGVPSTANYVLAALLILIYALARWGSGREIVLGGAVVLATMVRSFVADPGDLQNTIGGIAVVAVCVTLGAVFRTRESGRRQRLESVRLEERERLARDLHDTVAHHVSAIAVRAQAGIVTAKTDPDAADEALRVIEDEAAQTLREMRTMVGVLREVPRGGDDPAPRAPVPTLVDVPTLTSSRAASPRVAVEMRGDLARVPAAVSTAAYRIVQEAVTNARRHARGATSIAVTVTVEADGVGIRVSDDGRAATVRGQGYGLAGMAERAALLGGTCTSGPGASGWVVEARLPFGASR